MSSPLHRRVICPGCGEEVVNSGNHARYSAVCTAEKRFWGRVDASPGPLACWPWNGAVTTHGYGCAMHNGRILGAHKIAYLLTKGDVGPGLEIRHSCDNRRCCNPAHLSTGTKQDNMDDKVARGRTPKTMKRKLTAEAVREIRRLRGKASSGEIAKRFGISQSYTFGIWSGRCWKGVE